MVPAVSDGGQPNGFADRAGPSRQGSENGAGRRRTVGDTVGVGDLLEARRLHKAYRNEVAVDGIDLTVTAGERVGLLGPNGAGKTTTLLMLLGAITPDQGQVTIAGCALPRQRSQAMEHVGFVAGYLPLPDRLRVREALDLFARFYGIRRPGPHIDAALERFRILHLADRMCLELSSGQRTLVGICKAILHQPDLLVLDEPTASLDPDVAYRVRTGLADLCRENGTALLVTSHDMNEVEQLCSRVVFLSRGQIVADGTPELIASQFGHGSLEDVFLELAGTERVDETIGHPIHAATPEARPLATPSPAERRRAGDTASRRAGDTASRRAGDVAS
jgi:ABC-2 type transport system ATP-binding protein